MAKQTRTRPDPRVPPPKLGFILALHGDKTIPVIRLWHAHVKKVGGKWTKRQTVTNAENFFAGIAAALEAITKTGVIDLPATERRRIVKHARALAMKGIEWAADPDADYKYDTPILH